MIKYLGIPNNAFKSTHPPFFVGALIAREKSVNSLNYVKGDRVVKQKTPCNTKRRF